MIHTFPPNAGGFGGRGRIATMEDINAYREFNNNYYLGGTFNNETAYCITTTNHNENNNNQNNNKNTKRNNHLHRCAPRLSSLSCNSRWAESEASHRFDSQWHQFYRGTRGFMSRNHPLPRNLIAMTNMVSRQAFQKRNLGLVNTALQLAQAESAAVQQVAASAEELWKSEKYGHAPQEKPAHSIRIMMENFNSLCVTSGNAKINAINGLCRNFKINLLCGCETQVDWRIVSQTRRFYNLFGAGSKMRSVLAHYINKCIWINQFGGCAIMAMGTLAPKVADSGEDSIGLGQWCWICVGSGSKKMQIVMAYQPCNSGNTTTRNTINDQHLQYF
jgi:hypothetical protein